MTSMKLAHNGFLISGYRNILFLRDKHLINGIIAINYKTYIKTKAINHQHFCSIALGNTNEDNKGERKKE